MNCEHEWEMDGTCWDDGSRPCKHCSAGLMSDGRIVKHNAGHDFLDGIGCLGFAAIFIYFMSKIISLVLGN